MLGARGTWTGPRKTSSRGLSIGSHSLKQDFPIRKAFPCGVPKPSPLPPGPASAPTPPHLGYNAVSVFSPSLNIIF